MPIIYSHDPLEGKTETEKRRIKERIKYYKGRRQLRYNQKHASKVRKYLSQYYQEQKQKYKAEKENIETPDNSEAENNKRYQVIEESIISNMKNPLRARVGRNEIKKIMLEIVKLKCKQYSDNSVMKKKILCIIGSSGVGKTLASLHLQNKLGANVICSFTTRPARTTEVEGRDHHFVDIDPPSDDILALVRFGNYKYYALKSQVYGDCTVYVIDEAGYRNLIKRNGDKFEIYTLYITRNRKNRIDSGISHSRMERDRSRVKLDSYDYIVENNSTKKEFFNKIDEIYNEIKSK